MQSTTQQLSAGGIMQVGMGFWPSKVLLTAVNEGLFTSLAEQPLSLPEIKKKSGWNCTDRHGLDFLDTLLALKFLQRNGIGESAVYSNSEETDFFLDKNKPSYMGGFLEMANNRLFRFWANLDDGLRTGNAQNEIKDGGDNLFAAIYQSPELLRGFINAMSGISIGNFRALATGFDFSKYQTLCDIGGAGGMLSIQVAKANPHIQCTSFDLAPVEPIAKEIIEKFGFSNKIKTAAGDFFTDNFPKADIITMGMILHDWSEEKKMELVKKAYDALPDGGAFVAIENIIDNERNQNVFGLTMSLNMLIETAEGFDFTLDDFSRWTKEAGFKSVDILHLAGPASAAIAYK
ncbi:MAG: methyltransferase [Bacteroidota bacterium]